MSHAGLWVTQAGQCVRPSKCTCVPWGGFERVLWLEGFDTCLKGVYIMTFRLQEFRVQSLPVLAQGLHGAFPTALPDRAGGTCTACLLAYFSVDVIFLNKFPFSLLFKLTAFLFNKL